MSSDYSLSFGPSPFWLRLIGRLLELLRPLLTSRSSMRCRPFRHKARSPQVRTHSFIAQPPDLRRLTLGHKSFAVSCPLALVGNAFYPVLVHRLTIYAPRFLPTLGRPHAVALHFAHCDQLAGGLAPPGVRPCWAHKKKPRTCGARPLYKRDQAATAVLRFLRRARAPTIPRPASSMAKDSGSGTALTAPSTPERCTL